MQSLRRTPWVTGPFNTDACILCTLWSKRDDAPDQSTPTEDKSPFQISRWRYKQNDHAWSRTTVTRVNSWHSQNGRHHYMSVTDALTHYNDVIMGAIASQITSLTIDCLLNRLSRRRSNKTSKLRVTGLCAGNSPVTGEFPAQMASNAENVSIWWRHHGQVGVCHLDYSTALMMLHDSYSKSNIHSRRRHRTCYA